MRYRQFASSIKNFTLSTLDAARQQLIVIDNAFYIFKEYMKEVSPSGQPGIGDAFLRWLHQNQLNPERSEIVALTPNDRNSFDEFPSAPDLADFDPSDHKFVAVANISAHAPEILNAVDSDWWIHGKVLERNGLEIVHICEGQVILWEQTRTQK